MLKTSKTAKCPRLGEDSSKIGLKYASPWRGFFAKNAQNVQNRKKASPRRGVYSPIFAESSPRRGNFAVLDVFSKMASPRRGLFAALLLAANNMNFELKNTH